MHELALAQSIIEQATVAVREAGWASVDVVKLRIGALSGVSADALANCWEIATSNTILQASALDCEIVPVTLYCHSCHSLEVSSIPWLAICPTCGSPSNDVRTGKELELVSLECP